jgi:glucose-1-phosphate cytidylyltransferase
MKVVLFCGGLGTRLREHSETIPKPLVSIGYRPIVWHLMRYYASFGHTEFILCLGYRGDAIREYFLHYNEAMSNDFTLSDGGKRIELHKSDLDDWRITFVDTGLHSNIGERLLSVRERLKDETMFLANYSDGLSDIPLDTMIAKFEQSEAVATFAAVSAASSFPHRLRYGLSSLRILRARLKSKNTTIDSSHPTPHPQLQTEIFLAQKLFVVKKTEGLQTFTARIQLATITRTVEFEGNKTRAAGRLGYRRTSLQTLLRRLTLSSR